MVREERSRTCSVTGLRVFAGAQALTVANAVAAVLALAVGGLFGMLIGFSRAPGWAHRSSSSFHSNIGKSTTQTNRKSVGSNSLCRSLNFCPQYKRS